MYVKDNKIIAVFSEYDLSTYSAEYSNEVKCYAYESARLVVKIYDVADKDAPKMIKSFKQDGTYISSRMVDNNLYVVSNYTVNLGQKDKNLKESCIPTTTKDDKKTSRVSADDIYMLPSVDINSYTIVSGIDIDNEKKDPKTKAVLGGANDVYCTKDSLYAARIVYNQSVLLNECKTEIYKFSLSNGDITFSNKGEVMGYAINQFSLDEHNGYLRIATTQSRTSQGSNIFILDKTLNIVGSIRNIAKNESIQSVRFSGDKGYVVTFEQIDPLFVIDLANPKSPKILGELKIPGFSSYLHMYSDNLLIGVGTNADLEGRQNGLKISLFDISDSANPKELDSLVFSGYVSPAQHQHKAFMISKSHGLFGIPVEKYVDPMDYEYSFLTFRVEGNKLEIASRYINQKNVAADNARYSEGYDSYQWSVKRSIYIKDTLYLYSDLMLKAFSLKTHEYLNQISL
jgi:uncharacterized secreted protein with C-terminal beta-propeller domain